MFAQSSNASTGTSKKRKAAESEDYVQQKEAKVEADQPKPSEEQKPAATIPEFINTLKTIYPDLHETPFGNDQGLIQLRRAQTEWELQSQYQGAIIFDWDNTNADDLASFEQNKIVFIYKKQIQTILDEAYKNNHLLVIATARKYADVKDQWNNPFPILEGIVELDPKQRISQIFYTNGQVKDDIPEYINKQFKIPYDKMIAVDDLLGFFQASMRLGVKVIEASTCGLHINPLRKALSLPPVFIRTREEFHFGELGKFARTKLRPALERELNSKKLIVLGTNNVFLNSEKTQLGIREWIKLPELRAIFEIAAKNEFSIIICTGQHQKTIEHLRKPCEFLKSVKLLDPEQFISDVFFTGIPNTLHSYYKLESIEFMRECLLPGVKPEDVIVVDTANHLNHLRKEYKKILATPDGAHIDRLRAEIDSLVASKKAAPSSALEVLSLFAEPAKEAKEAKEPKVIETPKVTEPAVNTITVERRASIGWSTGSA